MLEDEKLDEGVFKAALDQWGEKAQIGMFIEEVGEALTAINHYDRGRIPLEELVEEFVDVFIMVSQMRYMNEYLFDVILEKKVNRIRKKLGLKNGPKLL